MHRIYEGNISNEKGVWCKVFTPTGQFVHISCPDCGRSISLENYDILSDGRLLPNVVCLYADCTFNKYCQLMDWVSESRGQSDR